MAALNDFRKSNYKQANPKTKLPGQQKPQAILHVFRKDTDTSPFLFHRSLYIKAKGQPDHGFAAMTSTACLCFTAAWTGRGETHLYLLNIGIY